MPNIIKYGLVGLAPRRKLVGFTQAQLAEAMGIDRARLAMWELGYAWPSAAFLPKMADLLCCTIDELYQVPEDSVAQSAEDDHAE